MQNGAILPKLAFLGPIGTYSHQVAYDAFGDAVDYQPCRTIKDVFCSVGTCSNVGVLPQENTIFGSVVETYDLLRDPSLGKEKWICGTLSLPIQHSLLVRRGKSLKDITKVLSHEQALGQCRLFLQSHLPSADVMAVPSTAAAAEIICRDPAAFNYAAICSKFCVKVFPDLEASYESIQNESHNFTRFYILSDKREYSPYPRSAGDSRHHALLRLRAGARARKMTTITDVVSALQLPASRIDRRPSLEHGCPDNVYIVEIFSHGAQYASGLGAPSRDDWYEEIREGIKRVNDIGGEATLLGLW